MNLKRIKESLAHSLIFSREDFWKNCYGRSPDSKAVSLYPSRTFIWAVDYW